jgi:hypothetical protein
MGRYIYKVNIGKQQKTKWLSSHRGKDKTTKPTGIKK